MRFPEPASVGIPSPRPGGIPVIVQPNLDRSAEGIAQGVQGFAQGVGQAASAIDEIAARQQQQETAVDLSRAEAFRTGKYLDIQNQVARDNNYATFTDRYTPAVDDAVTQAGALIRDDATRAKWLAEQASGKLTMLDAIHDHGVTLQDNFNRAGLESSLGDNAKLMSDPTVPAPVRDKARKDMQGSIDMGVKTGLIDPGQGVQLSDKYLKGADNTLAYNRAQYDIIVDPQRAKIDLAIPAPGTAGSSVLDAQLAVDGKPAALEFSMAKATAHLLGDANFPMNDPKAAAAYLSDPTVALDYSEAAQAHLSDRYKGDLSAVVIAMDPNGGTSVADKWVASHHNERVLPGDVRSRYSKVMASMTAQQPYERIPIQTEPGLNLQTIDPAVLQRYEQVQSLFGRALPVVSGGQTNALSVPAINVDVSGLNNEQRQRLVEMASTGGFTGIGIGKNTLTFATGPLRTWSTDGGNLPAWSKDVAATHEAGAVKPMPVLYSGVAPQYADLTFDQRLQLYDRANTALKDQQVGMKSSLLTVVDNAPAAIGATGKYDGDMPTATQFVQAFGAAEGIQRYESFEAAVDTSKTQFSMRTMPNQQIDDTLRQAQPYSSGNNAALEQARYQTLSAAAKSIRDARDKDPAGYVMSTFPAVAAAFKAADSDKTQFPAALRMMAEAQTQLGIKNPELIPTALAAQAADTFNDKTLPAQQRIAGPAGLILATTDPAQQDAIFRQLVGAHLPGLTAGAFNAMRRGDSAAAQTLMRAALFQSDVKVNLPTGQSDGDIQNALFSDVFSSGKIGAITYGAIGATADNSDMVKSAADLMFNDVKQRLMDGSASDLNKAVELSTKDMFGDVQTVSNRSSGGTFGFGTTVGINVTAPQDADPNVLRAGFNNLAPIVRANLRAVALGPGLPNAAPGVQKGLSWSIDNGVDAAMTEGYFVNGDGFLPNGQKGFVYYDPGSDGAVTAPDGKPLVFSLADVMAASKGGPNMSGSPDARLGR